MKTMRLTVALGIVMIASSAFAQDWRGQLKKVDNDLRAGKYAHARKWSIKLINSMSDHLGTGDAAAYTMALPIAYRALAEKGLQKDADADWYWHVATSMHPAIAKRDWTPYGEVGKWASTHTDDFEVTETTIVPMKRREPKCPLGAIKGGYYQPVRIGAIISDDGTAKFPSLATPSQAPTLVYAAFEALKNWTFQTGASAKYEVTVNFAPPAP